MVSGPVSRDCTDPPRMVVRDVCDRHSKLAGGRRNTPGSMIVYFGLRLCLLLSAINPNAGPRCLWTRGKTPMQLCICGRKSLAKFGWLLHLSSTIGGTFLYM